jgi:hypothetical protein
MAIYSEYMQIQGLPEESSLIFVGAGDDRSLGKGKGTDFKSQTTTQGTYNVTSYFNDWVYIIGGNVVCNNAQFGDYVEFMMYAGASSTTPNGGGTGNCNLYSLGGGANLITAANGDGDYDVDLENDAIPVPNANRQGFWDWDSPDEGLGTITPNYNQKGWYDLYDFQISLNQHALKVWLLGNIQYKLRIDTIISNKFLPHWTCKATIYNSGNANLDVVWFLAIGRMVTV